MKSVKKIRKKNIVFTFDFSKMKNRLHNKHEIEDKALFTIAYEYGFG